MGYIQDQADNLLTLLSWTKRSRISRALSSRALGALSLVLILAHPLSFAHAHDCRFELTREIEQLLRDPSNHAVPVDLASPLIRRGERNHRALFPLTEQDDLRRLVNEQDWAQAQITPATSATPWLAYGRSTSQDWMNTAQWIADGADGRPIDLELLQEIHRRAMRNHYFVGAVNRRIIAEARALGLPEETFMPEVRRVIAEKTSPRFPDPSIFRGTLRSNAVDDLPHDGSLLLPGNQHRFSQEEYEAMLRNPYMYPDPRHPPVFDAATRTVRARFRYVSPERVESSARAIFTQLNRSLNDATTTEDVILAVVRMNRQMLATHPFQDGNGRSIRLMSDLIFQRYGLPPPLYPNERDLEMTNSETVQFILRGMRDYAELHTPEVREGISHSSPRLHT